MNTRLQVEHGVTEMITGVDLVELQIRAALGQPLPISQADVVPNGHAIEARIYPENPENFMPSVGTITDFHLPAGDSLRVDSALCSGYEVTLHYEPLLAKVMCLGGDRAQALKGMFQALRDLRIAGVKTNIPWCRRLSSRKNSRGPLITPAPFPNGSRTASNPSNTAKLTLARTACPPKNTTTATGKKRRPWGQPSQWRWRPTERRPHSTP